MSGAQREAVNSTDPIKEGRTRKVTEEFEQLSSCAKEEVNSKKMCPDVVGSKNYCRITSYLNLLLPSFLFQVLSFNRSASHLSCFVIPGRSVGILVEQWYTPLRSESFDFC